MSVFKGGTWKPPIPVDVEQPVESATNGDIEPHSDESETGSQASEAVAQETETKETQETKAVSTKPKADSSSNKAKSGTKSETKNGKGQSKSGTNVYTGDEVVSLDSVRPVSSSDAKEILSRLEFTTPKIRGEILSGMLEHGGFAEMKLPKKTAEPISKMVIESNDAIKKAVVERVAPDVADNVKKTVLKSWGENAGESVRKVVRGLAIKWFKKDKTLSLSAKPAGEEEVLEFWATLDPKNYPVDVMPIAVVREFFDHYESIGWTQGKDRKPIQDWKAVFRKCLKWKKCQDLISAARRAKREADRRAEAVAKGKSAQESTVKMSDLLAASKAKKVDANA